MLQPLARRLAWAALVRSRLDDGLRRGRRPAGPGPLVKLTAPVVARLSAYFNGASDPAVRSDLINLDFHLDRADRFIERGALGGTEVPNAADLQIGSGVRLLLTIEDLLPRIEGRPCEASRGGGSRATRAASPRDAPGGLARRAGAAPGLRPAPAGRVNCAG